MARERPPAAIDTEALYLKWKWRADLSDHTTGLDNAALKDGTLRLVAERPADEPWVMTRARLFAYLADSMAIGFSKFDCFPAIASWNRWDRPLTKVLKDREKEVDARYAPSTYRYRRLPSPLLSILRRLPLSYWPLRFLLLSICPT